jgi:hypothetical protein
MLGLTDRTNRALKPSEKPRRAFDAGGCDSAQHSRLKAALALVELDFRFRWEREF